METAKKDLNGIRYAPISTPIGQLYVAYRGKSVCCVALASGVRDFERSCARGLGVRPMGDARLPDGLTRQILDHMIGKRRFSGRLELSGFTPFQRRVLKKTLEIPAGEVRSYQWVAKEIGANRAVRAVGTALARNPIPFLIPCHRVVRSNGRIGHYSAGGPSMKAKVLAFEGVDLDGLARLATRRVRFVGSGARKSFCLPTCRSARRILEERAVFFAIQRDAVRMGYRPCQNCRPAQVSQVRQSAGPEVKPGRQVK